MKTDRELYDALSGALAHTTVTEQDFAVAIRVVREHDQPLAWKAVALALAKTLDEAGAICEEETFRPDGRALRLAFRRECAADGIEL